MTPEIGTSVASILTAGAAIIAALAGLIGATVSLINRFGLHSVKAEQESTRLALHEIKISLDGNLHRMLEMATSSGIGTGIQRERDQAKAGAELLIERAAIVAADLRNAAMKQQAPEQPAVQADTSTLAIVASELKDTADRLQTKVDEAPSPLPTPKPVGKSGR